MGIRNLRAICPNCGGKIATQPKGLGHFTWANSWMMVQTGTECQHCGAALSGRVGPGNKAIAAEDADLSWWERTKKEAGMGSPDRSESVQVAPDSVAADPEAAERAAQWERQRREREREAAPVEAGGLAWQREITRRIREAKKAGKSRKEIRAMAKEWKQERKAAKR